MTTLPADHQSGPVIDNTVDTPGVRTPLVLNMDTFNQVTERVSRVFRGATGSTGVVHLFRHEPGDARDSWCLCPVPPCNRCWCVGAQHACCLGIRHHQLCFLGGYWSRRHTHQCDPLPLQAEVANGNQPVRGGDDDLRGHVCKGSFPAFTSVGSG